MLSILNNVSAMSAENSLSTTQMNLQNTLTQLSTGSRINSGADDAAGLSIANGMQANIAALTQSSQNVTNSVGRLQTADGALSQVTSLLNRGVTIATEAANGNLSTDQSAALNTEYTSIQAEINQIGQSTNFNGQNVFSATAQNTFISDGITSGANATIATSVDPLSTATLGPTASSVDISTTDLTNASDAAAALTALTSAIDAVSAQRGQIGASVNRLTAATNVINSQVQNLTSASNGIKNADVGKTVANMTQYNILQSTGMAALQQANQSQQAVLKLLQ